METTLLNRFAAISAANPHWLSPSSCISRCRDNNCIRFCTLSSVAEAAWCTSRSMKFLESNISTAMSIHSTANTQKPNAKKGAQTEKTKMRNQDLKPSSRRRFETHEDPFFFFNLSNPKPNRQNRAWTFLRNALNNPCLTTLCSIIRISKFRIRPIRR
jgi:hypothetical protein